MFYGYFWGMLGRNQNTHKTNRPALKGINGTTIYSNPQFSVKQIHVKKGSIIAEHYSSTDAVLYVLKGNCVFVMSGNEHKLGEMDFISIDANEKHLIKATSDLLFLLIR